MKFVTVMDMWLLIMNIGLLGVIVYFGRNVIKTLSRIAVVSEKSTGSAERSRIIQIIQSEIDIWQHMKTMTPSNDHDAQVALELLEELKARISTTKN